MCKNLQNGDNFRDNRIRLTVRRRRHSRVAASTVGEAKRERKVEPETGKTSSGLLVVLHLSLPMHQPEC